MIELSRLRESGELAALTPKQRNYILAAIEHSRFHYWHEQADAQAAALSALDSLAADRLAVLALGKTPIEQTEATVAASSLAQWVKTRFVHVEEFNALLLRLADMEKERDKLTAFKDLVHSCLDSKGVPHHPPGTHGAEGCRIGDRMDWLMAQLTEAVGLLEECVAKSDRVLQKHGLPVPDFVQRVKEFIAARQLSQSRAAKEG